MFRFIFPALLMLPAIATADRKLPVPEISIPNIATQQESLPEQEFQPAQVKARIGPIYPIYYAKKKKEGWVELTYSVEKDGSVSNVMVTGDSGGEQFVTAAKKAIKTWKYRPALEWNKPVQSNIHNMRLTFKFDRDKTIREKVYQLYMQGLGFIAENNRDGMQEVYQDLNEISVRMYGEKDFTDVYTLNYASHMKDTALFKSTLQQIELASIIDTFPELYAELTVEKVKLLAEEHKLAEAQYFLEGVDPTKHSGVNQTELDTIRDQLDQHINSGIDLVITGKTNKRGIWHHHLARNHFAITNLEGKLDSIDIRCDNTRRLINIEANSEWKIPKKWKDCVLYFQTDKSAQFTLVEFATS